MEKKLRHYKKWSINEVIQLQREYELLQLSIQEIAKRHKRSVRAILCKLEKEKIILDWYEAKGFYEYVIFQQSVTGWPKKFFVKLGIAGLDKKNNYNPVNALNYIWLLE